jgi:glucose uptake protein GlcU
VGLGSGRRLPGLGWAIGEIYMVLPYEARGVSKGFDSPDRSPLGSLSS